MSEAAIDAVYTWVDGSDPNWIAAKRGALDALGDEVSEYMRNGLSDARFVSRDEFRYSLRSLERYAPFVRRVHVITAGQTPSWMKVDHPDLQLVFHKDLFPDPKHLPTFNSCAIETHLHRLPGLSERFIYFNDDFFLSRSLSLDKFFDANDRGVLYRGAPVRWNKNHPGYTHHVSRKARNNSRLLDSAFGFQIRSKLAHVPYALRRSVFEDLWEHYPKELDATSSHAFRHPSDLSPASSLAPHHALCTDRATHAGRTRLTHFKIKDRSWVPPLIGAQFLAHWLLPGLRQDFMAINDGDTVSRSQFVNWAIPAMLRRVYPKKSRFEL